MNANLSTEQLWGKYRRLQTELAAAYAEVHWDRRRVDRLADEIARLEQQLSRQGASPVASAAAVASPPAV